MFGAALKHIQFDATTGQLLMRRSVGITRVAAVELSAWPTAPALPSETGRFASIMDALRDDSNHRFALEELLPG